MEFGGSVTELSCPSGFEGSKKTSVGNLTFFLFDTAASGYEGLAPRRWLVATGRIDSGSGR